MTSHYFWYLTGIFVLMLSVIEAWKWTFSKVRGMLEKGQEDFETLDTALALRLCSVLDAMSPALWVTRQDQCCVLTDLDC